MPCFPGKTGQHEQRLAAGQTSKQVQLPWDHTLTGPEQPPCHFFQVEQATMNSVCRPGEPQNMARETGTRILSRFFSLRGSRALSRARKRTVLSDALQSRAENRAFMCRCVCNSTPLLLTSKKWRLQREGRQSRRQGVEMKSGWLFDKPRPNYWLRVAASNLASQSPCLAGVTQCHCNPQGDFLRFLGRLRGPEDGVERVLGQTCDFSGDQHISSDFLRS